MLDLPYIAKSIGALSGVPVRLFEHGARTYEWFPAKLPKDPLTLYESEIFSIAAHVGYYVTPLFHYYGIIRRGDAAFVIGPTSQIMANEQDLRELAFKLDVPKEDVSAFVSGMNGIMRLPVETLLSMLCTMNHFLTGGEMLALSDVAIYGAEQESIKTSVEKRRTARVYEETPRVQQMHNVLAIEEALMEIVRKGDTVALRRWLSDAPAVRGGTIASNQLRQLKNTFIVELLNDQSKIMNLQYHMILEFTEQVEKLHLGRHPTKLATDVANYVRHHLSEPISTERMAEEFYLSRPYLSAKFKQETGETLTGFILREKTEEAKRLLRYSDKPASAIGAYLGFSSHGHFIRVFKRYAGMTPNEYRANP